MFKMCSLAEEKIYIFAACIFSSVIFFAATEDVCDDNSGICRIASNCPIFPKMHYFKEFDLKAPCAYTNNDDLICCPNDKEPNSCTIHPNRKFEQECKRYDDGRKLKQRCSRVRPYMAGGRKAVPKDFPFMARLGRYNPNNDSSIEWICGGTLISDKFVLSAAHCFTSEGERLNKKFRVRLGDFDFQSTADDAYIQEFDVESYCTYDDFKPIYDIAVIKLNRTVEFTEYVFPACLPSPSCAPFPNLQATGWGITVSNGEPSPYLLEVVLSKFDFACYCDDGDEDTRSSMTQICYGSNKTIENTCSGDSGSPLFWIHPNYDCMTLVFGIVSGATNAECDKGISGYTKVSHFLEYIENIVWRNKTCREAKELSENDETAPDNPKCPFKPDEE